MRFPDEPIPDCVPEFYREQEEERDRRYDLAMQRREHYQANRRKLDAAAEAGLRQYGYANEDFPQVELAMQARYTKYKLGNKAISRERALCLLGRRKYLSGIARSAFHYTAARNVGENEESGVVFFDSSRLFK